MLTLIQPESILMDCIAPKLQDANQEYVILGLDEFCETRSFEFGQDAASSYTPHANSYWLGAPAHSLSKDMLQSFCEVSDQAVWINDPIRVWQTHYYGYQLRMAELSGFKIPKTIITQDATRLSDFKKKYHNEVIEIAQKDSRARTHIYRESITSGDRIRIYVFGEKLCALNLGPFIEMQDSSESDNQRFWPLDKDISKSVGKFMRLSRLDFGIIDLARLESGEMIWIGFSTDTIVLARDDRQFPFAQLCAALVEFLSET